MRDGRYGVPVKQEYRGNVNGIIHDHHLQFHIFIEPAAVVELNNKLRNWKLRKLMKIQIILANLSMACRAYLRIKNRHENIT